MLLLFAPFAFGMLFALFGDKIPIDDRLAIACVLIAAFTYAQGRLAGRRPVRLLLRADLVRHPRDQKLKNWDKHGDFSYGIYIIAWPLMQFAAYFGLQNAGWLVYHVVIVAGCHVYAFLSWHLDRAARAAVEGLDAEVAVGDSSDARPQRAAWTGWTRTRARACG